MTKMACSLSLDFAEMLFLKNALQYYIKNWKQRKIRIK